MTLRRLGFWLTLAALAGTAYWVYVRRPTISGLLGDLVRPLTQSRVAVRAAERKRLVSNASSSVERPLRALRVGMTYQEARRILGNPKKVEEFRQGERQRVRWTYPGIKRVLIFQDGRVVSILVS